MGQRIITLASQNPEYKLVAALENADCPAIGRDAGELAGLGKIGVAIATSVSSKPDVLIDFSTPESTVARALEFAATGTPLVIGTTALTEIHISALKEAGEKVPCVFAPNMSAGVNVLGKLLKTAITALGPEYDIEIIEAHHRLKKDAPSGTALKLAKIAADASGGNAGERIVNGREGKETARTPGEIGVHAIRAGDIVGEHTIVLGGLGERLELKHIAHSRDTFARGALLAAKFVIGKKPSLYTMEDVLGIR